ncbi:MULTISPECIES: hypothetical protein [unclassified Streptomyces]|uniref:hypothetical protein n=1 Tax=unclassified Streptomyces TaxID=2593676 RepID=UPI00340DFF2A
MPVRIERQEHVTTVALSRPGVRNAADGPTAAGLADAFRAGVGRHGSFGEN